MHSITVIDIRDALTAGEFEDQMEEIFIAYPQHPIFVLFTAEKIGGRAWCPDCVNAEPIILSALEEFAPECVLISFSVKVSLCLK
jgi:hypothetical protein